MTETLGQANSVNSDDKYVLIDLDGTLIGSNYEFTDPKIPSTIKEVQNYGWRIGLSSDTPLEALHVWKNRLMMNGPIIAERGAIIDLNDQVFMEYNDVESFAQARGEIETYLQKNRVCLWRGNPVEAIREHLKMGCPGEAVVLVNALRRCSVGLFVREVAGDGNMIINSHLTDQIVEKIRNFYPNFSDLEEDVNHDYGVVIISRGGTTKRSGTKKLCALESLNQVAMVGNSITDYVGEDLALHYAVSNATKQFKEKAVYIAKNPFTSGVIEILQYLSKGGEAENRESRS